MTHPCLVTCKSFPQWQRLSALLRTVANGCGRLRTVADGCGRLRTVADGCEHRNNGSRTKLYPQTPKELNKNALRYAFGKTLEARLQRNRGSLPHTPSFLLGSLCLGTSLLIFCDGSALRPFGRWARAMGTGRLQSPVLGCGMSLFQKKLLVAQRQFACV